jgi:RNA polymerase sigma-70 factor (ECF subfamily)
VTAPRDHPASSAQTLELTFQAERRRMLRFFAWHVGRDAAPDLLQDVFMRAAGSPNAQHIDNLTPYVWQIARNLLIDRARQRRRHPPLFVPFDEERDPPAKPEQTLRIEADDVLRLYRQALDSLPEKTRRVFLMSRAEHLTYREISARLGISVATVKYHMMRGFDALRKRFAAAGYAGRLGRSGAQASLPPNATG